MSSRTFNSIRNTVYAFLSQGIGSILAFVTRTIFIYTLGNTYLGLSGLFSDILTLLSLAELGIGTAITYSMYKPVAEKDEKKIAALLNLYGRVYCIIGIVVTIIGLCLTPFLSFFISDMPSIKNLNVIYLLYLLNTTLSYFFVYKKSLLIASQSMYIASKIQAIISVFQHLIQIIVLLVFNNFILYLLIQVIFVVANNLYISIYVDKKYSYIKKYKNEKVNKLTQKEISKNIAAMFLSKVSSVIVTSTDNILISKFVSTIVLGYYSNYILFITFIRQIFTKLFEAITGSVGNLLAIESKEKSHKTFEKIFFVNFWLIGLSSIMFFVLINSFIDMWLGNKYKLNIIIVFFICLNLYMRFIRNTCLTFIDTCGLFWHVKWKCIAEAFINFITSIIYLKVFNLGIAGVLLGTFTSNILTNFWYEPYVIYRNRFNISTKSYFLKFFKYFFATMFAGIVSFMMCKNSFISIKIMDFIVDIIICILVVNGLYFIFFNKTEEYKYLKGVILNLIKKFKINK